MPRSRTDYEDLALVPALIAETVCDRPYRSEFSAKLASPAEDARIERLRQKLTPKQIGDFVLLVDAMCRLAYEREVAWFMSCVRAKNNTGRDRLYLLATHWLHSYLVNPALFARKVQAAAVVASKRRS